MCWRQMEKISWTDHVWSEEVLHRVKEGSYILRKIKRSKANWIGHILCRNYLLKRVIEGKIEGKIVVTGRGEKRCKQLLDDLKKQRGYWKWTCRKTDYRMNELWLRQQLLFKLSLSHNHKLCYVTSFGDRGGTVVKVLCYKSEGRWFDPRWCHWNFSLT